jgi:hypothetical protein
MIFYHLTLIIPPYTAPLHYISVSLSAPKYIIFFLDIYKNHNKKTEQNNTTKNTTEQQKKPKNTTPQKNRTEQKKTEFKGFLDYRGRGVIAH